MTRTRLIATLVALCLLAAALCQGKGGMAAQAGAGWTKLGFLPEGTWQLAPDGASNLLYSLGTEGVSRSTDGGASWSVCSRDARSLRVLTPQHGQSTGTQLYATTPGGLRASEDGCRTWRDVPAAGIVPSAANIRAIFPYPNNYTVLYAAMDGLGGLFRSTDAGATWHPASTGLPAAAWVTSLVADPQKPELVTVSVRYPGRDHPPAYIFRSTDGGLTWRSSGVGVVVTPNNDGHVLALAWSGGNLFAATPTDGLFVSGDRGATWKPATMPRRVAGVPVRSDDSPVRTVPPVIFAADANWDGTLLLSTSEGVYQSADGGSTWQAFAPAGEGGKRAMLSLDGHAGRGYLSVGGSIWSYTLPSGGAVTVHTATPAPTSSSTPTPPPPPRLPTNTPPPPTSTATATPVPPTPTVAIVEGPKPTDRVPPGNPENTDYFNETGHNVKFGFREFWRQNGGLAKFGYPLTDEFVENGVSVQYFERARFEYRDGAITLGRIGSELTAGQFFRPIPYFVSEDTNVYFGATGHSISGPFLDFWRANGREPFMGLPLSESFKDDGSEYQWFERARFEWHPDLPEDQRIVLGNLGTEILQKRGWLK